MGYLDNNGLQIFWSKIKNLVSSHTATVTPVIQSGVEIAEIDSVSIYAPSLSSVYESRQVTLNASSWSNNSISVAVVGVTPTSDIIVSSAPSDIRLWSGYGVYCFSQSTDLLTFKCVTTPAENLTANILIFSGGN